MSPKKILIVSNFFYPEITPRAFRVKELALAFCKKGYTVDVLLPNKQVYKLRPVENIEGLSFLYAGEVERKYNVPVRNNKGIRTSFLMLLKSYLKNFYFYFFPREIYQTYNSGITKALKAINIKYDVLLSISHPISIHISVIIGLFFNKKLREAVSIAEFSDPLFKGSFQIVFPLNHLFGYLFSYFFDFFVVPIEQAISKFKMFKKRNVYVIPQGFDFSDIVLNEYKKNSVPTFAYAGNFYRNLRDPTYFFDALVTLETNFVFKLYLSPENLFFRRLIDSYRNKIMGVIEIHDYIPRNQLIYELSSVDFLVNFQNENEAMSPSKLIDYALTKRPIISFNSKTFYLEKIKQFLDFDFSNKEFINLCNYDIDRVSEQFEHLFVKKII